MVRRILMGGLLILSAAWRSHAQDCAALRQMTIDGYVLEHMTADEMEAGPLVGRREMLPAHCLLRGEIDPHISAEGARFSIGFELRLPSDWNGKFFFQGGGGLDGLVRPAVGAMPNGSSTAPVALARGYAVASTDAGHEGQDGSFGRDQQARIDYYYRAIEVVTRVSQQAMASFYKKPVAHSYFVGCSNGGRQAMLAAQRFPLLFDGIVAGDPAFNLTAAADSEIWEDATYLRIAPTGLDGKPVLSRAFSDRDLNLLAQSVLNACDLLDGVKDGLIENPRACRYDPSLLSCKREKTDECLSQRQVAALKTAFGGPRTSKGTAIYATWPYDAGIGALGWRQWKLGTSQSAQSNALNMTLGLDATRSVHTDRYLEPIDPLHFNLDDATGLAVNAGAMENATSTMYTTFAQRGKMLLFTGMSDPIFSPNDLIDYYDRVQRDSRGTAAIDSWARLFLVPGMTHCSGGPALDDFDMLGALEQWVEQSKAPDTVTATGKNFPARERNLCPYPAYPAYAGNGSVNAAENFTCRRSIPPTLTVR